MKLNTIRLLFVAVVLAAALSWALDSPELPMEPDGYRFQFGVSLLAEDCDDGSAENQQCGGSFGIDSTTVSSGGGGGQQRVPCIWRFARAECQGQCFAPSDPQRADKRQLTHIEYCIDQVTDRIVETRSVDIDRCCA